MSENGEPVTGKDIEQLREAIAQKGKEIEGLRQTIEEMREQIQRREATGEPEELGKTLKDVSELLDIGGNIFGISRNGKSKGLFGLINNLSQLAEKSGSFQKKLGDKGVIDFRMNVGPIKGGSREEQKSKPLDLNIRKPRERILKAQTPNPITTPITAPIKEEEPIVDVFEEEDHVTVTVELPSVKEDDINLQVVDNALVISVSVDSDKGYDKRIELPTSVKEDSIESSYRNGILEVKLVKEEPEVEVGECN